jgi:hypothetical protein
VHTYRTYPENPAAAVRVGVIAKGGGAVTATSVDVWQLVP